MRNWSRRFLQISRTTFFKTAIFEAVHWSGYTRQKRDQQKLKMSRRRFAQAAQFSRAGRLSCSGSETTVTGGAGFDGAASAGVAVWTTAAALRWWSR
jgi:hypothetical protein